MGKAEGRWNDIAIVRLLQKTKFEESEKCLDGFTRLLQLESRNQEQYVLFCVLYEAGWSETLLRASMQMWINTSGHFVHNTTTDLCKT